jgi:hypothetical protein
MKVYDFVGARTRRSCASFSPKGIDVPFESVDIQRTEPHAGIPAEESARRPAVLELDDGSHLAESLAIRSTSTSCIRARR